MRLDFGEKRGAKTGDTADQTCAPANIPDYISYTPTSTNPLCALGLFHRLF